MTGEFRSKFHGIRNSLYAVISMAAVASLVGCDRAVNGNATPPIAPAAAAQNGTRAFDNGTGTITIKNGQASISWEAMFDEITRNKSVSVDELSCHKDNSFSASVSADLDPQNRDGQITELDMPIEGQATVTRQDWTQNNYAADGYPCADGHLTYGLDPANTANALISVLQSQR